MNSQRFFEERIFWYANLKYSIHWKNIFFVAVVVFSLSNGSLKNVNSHAVSLTKIVLNERIPSNSFINMREILIRMFYCLWWEFIMFYFWMHFIHLFDVNHFLDINHFLHTLADSFFPWKEKYLASTLNIRYQKSCQTRKMQL